MRATLSLPILGAALFTLGALALRFTRPSEEKSLPDPTPRQSPQDLPSLLERLRERGL